MAKVASESVKPKSAVKCRTCKDTKIANVKFVDAGTGKATFKQVACTWC